MPYSSRNNNTDVLFIQQYAVPYFGIIALAAKLKSKGYSADVLIGALENDIATEVKARKPAIVGISLLSPEHGWLIETAKKIKDVAPETVIIAGGIHAMFYPEEILNDSVVDLVCHSEGEDVIVDVLRAVQTGGDTSGLTGIAYRKGGGVVLNERAPLVAFDDSIIEDQEIYFRRYPKLAEDTVHRFFSSRGCPYRCSFCYNARIHDMFKGKGKYVRQKSVDNFIREIAGHTSRHRVTSVFFYDDLFTFNKDWLKRFLAEYGRGVKIPFMCTTRANVADEETISMLAEAGCRTISFGIETGNYELRKNVLNKNITDEQIVNCGRLAARYGLKVQTANMFCLPDETLQDALKTVELNINAKTDYAFSALFLPFPKTTITDYCIEKGLLKRDYSLKDLPHSFLTESMLDIPDKAAIINVHRLAYFSIKWPWFFGLSKRLARFYLLNGLFSAIFLLSNLIRHKDERGISLWHAVRYAWRMRKTF